MQCRRAALVLVLASVCGLASPLHATPDDAAERARLVAVLDDPARFGECPNALDALSRIADWTPEELMHVTRLFAARDPVIVGCAARAVGRQGAAALAAAPALADAFLDGAPADAAPAPAQSWADVRGRVYCYSQTDIMGARGGDTIWIWFDEREGQRFAWTVSSSYSGPPPPPPPSPPRPPSAPPGVAAGHAVHAVDARDVAPTEFESIGWMVRFDELDVNGDGAALRLSTVGRPDCTPMRFEDDGAALLAPWYGPGDRMQRLGLSSRRGLWSEAWEHASAALQSVCRGPEADETIAGFLSHGSADVRALAIRMITGRPAAAASAGVLLQLAADSERRESSLAIHAFLALPSGAAAALRDAALSGDERLIHKALSIAPRMGAQAEPVAGVLGNWLEHGGPVDDYTIIRTLRAMGESAAPAVRGLVLFITEHRLRHEQAIGVLGSIGPRARDALPIVLRIARTRPGFGYGRLEAVRALSRMEPDNPELPGLIVACCIDGNDSVVEHILPWVCGMHPVPDGTVEAVLTLVRRSNWSTRRAAASALGKIGRGRKDVSVVLAAMVDDEHHWVQVVAAEALYQVDPGHPRVMPVLRRLLADENWNYRWHAAMALEHIGPGARAALPDLRRHAADEGEHGHVRRAARKAIAAIVAAD